MVAYELHEVLEVGLERLLTQLKVSIMLFEWIFTCVELVGQPLSGLDLLWA